MTNMITIRCRNITEAAPHAPAMNIRRARQLSESWEIAFETLLSVLGYVRDRNLYLEENVNDIKESLSEIVSDLPNQREWSQPYLFKMCTMVTGSCSAKKKIKIAVNGWKTACESLYIIHNLSKSMEVGDNESIDEFESTVRDIFTEEWLWDTQDDAFGFEFCVDGFWSGNGNFEDENYESAATVIVENQTDEETDTECETEDESEDESEHESEDENYLSSDDDMPELEDVNLNGDVELPSVEEADATDAEDFPIDEEGCRIYLEQQPEEYRYWYIEGRELWREEENDDENSITC